MAGLAAHFPTRGATEGACFDETVVSCAPVTTTLVQPCHKTRRGAVSAGFGNQHAEKTGERTKNKRAKRKTFTRRTAFGSCPNLHTQPIRTRQRPPETNGTAPVSRSTCIDGRGHQMAKAEEGKEAPGGNPLKIHVLLLRTAQVSHPSQGM